MALNHARAARVRSPGRWRGAAAIEWLVVAPAVLAFGFGVLQWALLFHGRSVVEYAAFQGVRAAATEHAAPDALMQGIAVGLIPMRGAALVSLPVSASQAMASGLLQEDLAAGVAAWRQLRPTDADFDDWAVPAHDEEGQPIAGAVEIPNDNLRFRGSGVGARSGRTLVEANLLEIELVYAWPMQVPLIGHLAVRWMEWVDGCAAVPAAPSGPAWWGREHWQAAGGAWRCPYYRAGGRARWPLRVSASTRMHSAGRYAGGGAATGTAGSGPAPTGPAATGPAATGPAATGPAATGPVAGPSTSVPVSPDVGEEGAADGALADGEPRSQAGDEQRPASGGTAATSDIVFEQPQRPEWPGSVADDLRQRAGIRQSEACHADEADAPPEASPQARCDGLAAAATS